MTELKKRIDFKLTFSVTNANPNGDPLANNRPRTNNQGLGVVSDVALKRKLRNQLLQMGEPILIQSNDQNLDDINNVRDRVMSNDAISKIAEGDFSDKTFRDAATSAWYDVRGFGQLFAFKKGDKAFSGLSLGIRGPITIQQAVTIDPVNVTNMQITKSTNGEPGETRGSDTMGTKASIDFGLYVANGSISPLLAQKNGFTKEDSDLLYQALLRIFDEDYSSARPAGSMEVVRVDWWIHDYSDNKEQHPILSPAQTHRFVSITKKENVEDPTSLDDYLIVDNTPSYIEHQMFTDSL